MRKMQIEIKNKPNLRLRDRTYIMGILNRTPDSFSDGGEFMDEALALYRIKQMVCDGADIIDIGGESTRPGSSGISASEELERTIPLIKKATDALDVHISIDTTKHEVALEAIAAGASMVNDVTGLKGDPKMAEVVSGSGAMVCVMHIKGSPKDMQSNPTYDDLMQDIVKSLKESIDIALRAGISEDKIIVDPGIGFGKTIEHNLTIIKRLSELKVLHKPILIGTSRKSFIGNLLGKDVKERNFGTAATCALAIANGANILRVHEVKEITDVAKMTDAVIRG